MSKTPHIILQDIDLGQICQVTSTLDISYDEDNLISECMELSQTP